MELGITGIVLLSGNCRVNKMDIMKQMVMFLFFYSCFDWLIIIIFFFWFFFFQNSIRHNLSLNRYFINKKNLWNKWWCFCLLCFDLLINYLLVYYLIFFFPLPEFNSAQPVVKSILHQSPSISGRAGQGVVLEARPGLRSQADGPGVQEAKAAWGTLLQDSIRWGVIKVNWKVDKNLSSHTKKTWSIVG